jgi:tetratricopeptide (TPR) repeat protein
MKKYLYIGGAILINILLILLSLIVFVKTIELEELTEETSFSGGVVIASFFLLFIILNLVNSKKLFHIAFSLFFIVPTSILFFIYWTNYTFSKNGSFVPLKIRDAEQIEDRFYLSPAFKENESKIRVEQDKCFKVDTIEFMIKEGLFGYKVLTSEVKIIPNKNCDNSLCQNPTKEDYDYHFNNAQEYSKTRCYCQAICEFNKAISINKTESKTYYYRGTTFLALQNYKSAFVDFYKAIQIEKSFNSKEKLDIASNESTDELVNSILSVGTINDSTKVKSLNIEERISNILLADKLDSYITRYKFCLDKLKKTSDNTQFGEMAGSVVK